MYNSIPTFTVKTGEWSHTDFDTREEYLAFLWTLFKEPGQYNLDESTQYFNAEARKLKKDGVYCPVPVRSKDYAVYWDDQKEKCRNGVIFIGKETWLLPREYYMWLNFLPIYDKEKKKFDFPEIWDAQYHLALYEEIAKTSYKHVALLKKRQIASSYYHAARMINLYWFEEGSVCKMAASKKDYINEKGTWRFLEEYRNFLNEHTAWYRPSQPDKTFNWEQKIEINQGGRKRDVGLKSVIIGLTLEKDAAAGVGGACSLFFHEEAGIAPKMDETLEYLIPALKSGMVYTGMFAVAGSVGDLEQCDPLKGLIYNPDSKDILAVPTTWTNEKRELGMHGLFIPEQWSMKPCIDQYGNSMVEEALEMMHAERVIWKKTLKPADYQLRVSQKPMYIEEAFAYRKESKFPQHLVTRQIRRIEDKEYYEEHLELFRNEQGEVQAKNSTTIPIREFPLSMKTDDKTGCLVVWERPVANPPFGLYYGSIDPVSEGKTTTSESLCTIYIYKNTQEITKHKTDGSAEHIVEPGRLVAAWCGRFDDINKTHERLEMIIEWYNAWTVIENNVSLFIQHMQTKRKQRYLVPKSQILFLKELGANANVFQEYGWRNTGQMFKHNLLSHGIEFLTEELDHETKPNGDIVKTTYGIERLPDIMLMKEMQAYRDGLNVDRLVAYCALIAFVRVQESNRGYTRRTEHEETQLDKSPNNSKLKLSPFKHMGSNRQSNDLVRPSRNPFKNIR